MKLRHYLWMAVLFSGCAQGGWNIANPLASAPKRPVQRKLDKKAASQLSLARLSERHGQTDSAREIYKSIIKRYPNSQAANHRLGVVYAKQGQFKFAEHHLSKALETGPMTPEILTDVGYLYYLQDRLVDSEATYRRALELNPNFKSAHNNLAIALGEQGKYEESLKHFRLAVNDAQAIANLAFIQSQMGDEDLAKQNYHRALALDGTIKPAAEALIQLTKSQPAGPPNARVQTASFDKNSMQRLPNVEGRGDPRGQNALPRNSGPNRNVQADRTRPAFQQARRQDNRGFTVSDNGVSPQQATTQFPQRGQWQVPSWSPPNDWTRGGQQQPRQQ